MPLDAALGIGMGIVSGRLNDSRQIRQQELLNKLERKQMDYAQGLQMKTWNETNYEAQVAHLKKAGLNPGLLYGMGGAGGATTGNTSSGAAKAAGATNEQQGIMELGLQNQLLKAQKEVMESQADKNRAEADATRGVVTEEGKARIISLTQGVENQKAQQKLTEIETRLKEIQTNVSQQTEQDQIRYIQWNAEKALEELDQARRETWIKQQTVDHVINTIVETSIGAALENEIKKLKMEEQRAGITETYTKLTQGWNQLDRNERELRLKTFEAEMKANYPSLWNVAGRAINGMMEQLNHSIEGKALPGYKIDTNKPK